MTLIRPIVVQICYIILHYCTNTTVVTISTNATVVLDLLYKFTNRYDMDSLLRPHSWLFSRGEANVLQNRPIILFYSAL